MVPTFLKSLTVLLIYIQEVRFLRYELHEDSPNRTCSMPTACQKRKQQAIYRHGSPANPVQGHLVLDDPTSERCVLPNAQRQKNQPQLSTLEHRTRQDIDEALLSSLWLRTACLSCESLCQRKTGAPKYTTYWPIYHVL